MKKVVVFLAFIFIFSIGVAESPDVSSGKGTVVPSKYDITTDTAIPKDIGTSNQDDTDSVQTHKTISQKPGMTVPKTTSVQNVPVSVSQSPVEVPAQETNTMLQFIKSAFPNLKSFTAVGPVEKGSKLKIPSGAKFFIALVNDRWISYPITEGSTIFIAPESASLTYFAW